MNVVWCRSNSRMALTRVGDERDFEERTNHGGDVAGLLVPQGPPLGNHQLVHGQTHVPIATFVHKMAMEKRRYKCGLINTFTNYAREIGLELGLHAQAHGPNLNGHNWFAGLVKLVVKFV